jgi:hypothetical protein
MKHGMDTSFLVVVEMREHAEHLPARSILAQCLAAGISLSSLPRCLRSSSMLSPIPADSLNPLI